MCLVFVCDEDERTLNTQVAPGACPYCGGVITVTDVESQWRFCFVPFYFKTRRRHTCTRCGTRLVVTS
ncbi:uncharacterized protein LOC131037264 [Cryptomeria japonica]|uniref:uncharacterized protein LOC131037264 n=1 Tax=Cryptomeria japonica TaxID=3369 RepID=UPI0025AB946E|nr:uncharacterized protein LOC131037264 [Cryptomeria japonica]